MLSRDKLMSIPGLRVGLRQVLSVRAGTGLGPSLPWVVARHMAADAAPDAHGTWNARRRRSQLCPRVQDLAKNGCGLAGLYDQRDVRRRIGARIPAPFCGAFWAVVRVVPSSLPTQPDFRETSGSAPAPHPVCHAATSDAGPFDPSASSACLKCVITPAVSGSGRKLSLAATSSVGQAMRDHRSILSSSDSRYGARRANRDRTSS